MTDYPAFNNSDFISVNGAPLQDIAAARQGHVIITMTPGLTLEIGDAPGSQNKFVEECNGETFLAIRGDSIIRISLDPQFDWEFDRRKGMLDFKLGQHRRYYNVQYVPGPGPLKEIVLHARPTGEPETNPQTHSYDIFMMIKQQSGGGKPGRPLPVTIDPDVKNPPPIGSGQSNIPVPILSASS